MTLDTGIATLSHEVPKIKGPEGPFQHIFFKFLSLANTSHSLPKIFSPHPPPKTLSHTQTISSFIILAV